MNVNNPSKARAVMRNDIQPYLTVRVDPNEMVRYVHGLMTAPHAKTAPWGEGTAVARAAEIRWTALNRAFSDARVSTWTTRQKRDQLHVPAALIAAAGVARLTVAEDEVVFDIPTLLDATLELCEVVGHA
jgi:hypothetical protein